MDIAPASQHRLTAPRSVAVSIALGDRTAGLVTVVDEAGPRLHAWDVPSGTTRPITDHPANLLSTWLSHDGRHAYALSDDDGNELGHLTAVPLRDGGPAVDLTPTLAPYTVRGVGTCRTGAGLALIAVDRDGYHLYHLGSPDAPDPAPRELLAGPHETWNCLLSADGALVATDTTEHNPGRRKFAVRVVRVADGAVVGEFHDSTGASVEGHLFSPVPGDATLLVVTDRSGWRRPVLWRVTEDARHPLELGDLPGDVVPVDWSDDGGSVLLCQTHRAAQRLLRYELAADRWRSLDLPSGSCHDDLLRGQHFGPSCRFAPDQAVLAAVESLETPMTVYRHEPDGATRVVLSPAATPPGRPATSVDIPSSDGTMTQGWLAQPAGSGPFPAVIDVHGGPHWAWLDTYRPKAQVWLDHGCAYLALNYRGSTTFGAAYKEAVWGNVGHWETEDITAAWQWLVDHGVADPHRVLLTGMSYGGYLTLYAMSVRPDLWAGGIAEIAVADWTMAYEDANPAMRPAIAGWLGGTPDQVPERYRDRSPLTHLADLTAPVLIRQARNDTRTPGRQMMAYEQRARDLGKRVTVQWDDGGHGPQGDQFAFERLSLAFAADCVHRAATRP